MAEILYAAFPDASLAEKATGALLDHGVRSEDVSLISHTWAGSPTATTDTAAAAGNRAAAASDRMAAGVSGAVGAEGAAANYQASAQQRETWANTETADARTWTTSPEETHESRATDDSTELAAKGGLSTTTPQDAGVGAAKGAGIGLGAGALAALASLFIPGIGFVIGGGALATALAGAAGTTAAGAVAGGVHGYLKDQGMPEPVATTYKDALEHGGAVLAISTPSGDVDRATIEQILSKYGASNVNTYVWPAA